LKLLLPIVVPWAGAGTDRVERAAAGVQFSTGGEDQGVDERSDSAHLRRRRGVLGLIFQEMARSGGPVEPIKIAVGVEGDVIHDRRHLPDDVHRPGARVNGEEAGLVHRLPRVWESR